MLGIDTRAARAAWTVFLVALLLVTIYTTRRTLVVFSLALFFAYMLSPAITAVERFAPKRLPRTYSLAIVYVGILMVMVVAIVTIGGQIAEQASALAARVPDLVKNQDPLHNFPMPAWLEPYRERITQMLRDQANTLRDEALPLLQVAGLRLLSGVGNILTVVLIPILGFFFLKDGAELRGHVLHLLSTPSSRRFLDDVLADIHQLLAAYIRALLILSLATFVGYFMFLGLTGAPYALLLAGIAAILEFIPVVGPLLATLTIVVVAGFSGFPHLLWIVVFYVVWRLFQDYVLLPYLMSSGVEVHPLLVMFGVLAGEQIGGIPGMFFSVPVIAILRVILLRVEKEKARLQSFEAEHQA